MTEDIIKKTFDSGERITPESMQNLQAETFYFFIKDEEVGRFYLKDGQFHFSGKFHESALVLLEHVRMLHNQEA